MTILVLSVPTKGFGQEVVMDVAVQAIHASVDPMGNVYVLTKDHEFLKFGQDGKQEFSHTDLELGDQSKILADHAFKAMIYYPEYMLIRVFGNKLQELAELNLSSAGFGEVTTIGPSPGYQAFWIFDATRQRLIKLDQQYQVKFEGADLRNTIGESIFPSILKERDNWLYVYDKARGLYIFDNFGTILKKIAFTNATSFSVFQDRIFFVKDGDIYEADRNLGQVTPLNVHVEGKILNLQFRRVIIQDGARLRVVKF